MKPIVVVKAKNKVHKFQAVFPDKKTVSFGRKGYSDFTKHHDTKRMQRYLVRHQKREKWDRSGKYTPGFWARHVLWSKPSLKDAIRHTAKVLNHPVILKT